MDPYAGADSIYYGGQNPFGYYVYDEPGPEREGPGGRFLNLADTNGNRLYQQELTNDNSH